MEATTEKLIVGMSSREQKNTVHQVQTICQNNEVYLALPTTEGEQLTIPLLESAYARSNTEPRPAMGTEANGMIAVAFRWDVNPASGKILPNKDDYRDIVRLPMGLRQIVYKELQDDNNTELPWPSRLSPSTKNLVDDSVKLINNPSLRPGFIYLFKNNYLWRELLVLDSGLLQEVDLSKEAGKDIRIAKGVPQVSIIIPYKINNNCSNYQCCYSEVQWSWPRVNYYGGMAPEDSRIKQNPYHYFPSGINSNALQQRTITLNFQEVMTALMAGNTGPESLVNDHVVVGESLAQPVVLLPDPVGLAKRLLTDLVAAWDELTTIIAQVGTHPYFDSAILAYHLYFGITAEQPRYTGEMEARAITGINPAGVPSLGVKEVPTYKEGNLLYKASRYMDKNLIENLLAVKSRQLCRKHIRDLQQLLIGLLGDIYHENQQPLVLSCYKKKGKEPIFTGVSFEIAYGDFFATAPGRYAHAFAQLNSFFAMIHSDPAVLDNNLDLHPDLPDPEHVPGVLYILSLLKPNHYFNAMLLPSSDVINIYQAGRNQESPPCVPFSENKGDGSFRPKTFQCLFYASKTNTPQINVEIHKQAITPNRPIKDNKSHYLAVAQRAPVFLEKVIAGFIGSFKTSVRAFAKQLKNSEAIVITNSPLEASMRMVRATGDYAQLSLQASFSDDFDKAVTKPMVLGVDSLLVSPKQQILSATKKLGVPLYNQSENTPRTLILPEDNPGISAQRIDRQVVDTIRNRLKNELLIHVAVDSKLITPSHGEDTVQLT